MIKIIIRRTCLPFQIIFDAVRHRRNQRLMMSYALKIGQNFNCEKAVKG